MATLKSFCAQTMLFNRGKIAKKGLTDDVVDFYLQTALHELGSSQGEIYWRDKSQSPGGKELRLISIRLLGKENLPRNSFEAFQDVRIEITYELFERISNMRFVLQVLTSEGVVAFTSTDHNFRQGDYTSPGIYRTLCIIPAHLLNSGMYYVKVYAGCPGVKTLLEGTEFLDFRVESSNHHGSDFSEKWPGVLAPKLLWNIINIR